MPLPTKPWCAISLRNWDRLRTSRERTAISVASVAATYARAFADVVFTARLDAARAMGGLRQIAGLFSQSAELRRGWGNTPAAAPHRTKAPGVIGQRDGIKHSGLDYIAGLIY